MMIAFVTLICVLVSTVGSNKPAADIGLYQTQFMQGGSRLLLNPLNIFGNPPCEYRGNKGSCYGEVECLTLAGNYGNFCPGLKGLCCLFYRSCGQRTSQQHSYYRNVQYPLEDRAPQDCVFEVVKRDDDYCGVRVNMVKADLPEKTRGTCDGAYFQVTGIHNDKIPAKCGRMTGRQYTFETSHVDRIFLHIKSPRSAPISWNVEVTQVKCQDWLGEDFDDEDEGGVSGGSIGGGFPVFPPTVPGSGSSKPPPVFPPTVPGGGGSGSGGGKPPPVFPPPLPGVSTSTARPTTTTAFPPSIGPPAPPTNRPTTAPPTSNDQCGRRGPSFNSGGTRGPARRLFSEGPVGPHVFGSEGRRRKNNNNRRKRPGQRPAFVPDRVSTKQDKTPNTRPTGLVGDTLSVSGSIGRGAAITSLEWAVPTLNDTLFSHYAGERFGLGSRITFGTLAGIQEFPWQIAMTINGKFHCGASLISNTHALTAAHCVVKYKSTPQIVNLSLGDWDLSTNLEGPPSIKTTASRISVHPSYSSSTLQNDVAVIKLARRIEYTSNIRSICLPSGSLRLSGELATVSGWGRNEFKRLQTQLQHLDAIVMDNSECDRKWSSNGAARGFIVSSMLCMDSTSGDSCNGDSGGPSVYEYPTGSGNYVQVGIVSFGSGSCTDKSLPGVYTRVSNYLTWIKQQMN